MMSERTRSAEAETPGDDASEIRKLELELTGLIDRKEAIPAEIAAAENKIKEARTTLASVETRVEARREERQRGLADGREVKAITRDIDAIRQERELAEDTVAGLEAKVIALRAEELRVQIEDRPRLETEIARRKLVPLVVQYNTIAAQLAKVTEVIFGTMEVYRQGCSRYTSKILNVSSWDGFECVPCLSLDGRPAGDFFNISMVKERQRKAHEEQLRALIETERLSKEEVAVGA